MKRFFTLLMAVWALLSISQTVKAVDNVYLLTAQNINGVEGSYDEPKHQMELESDDTYKIKIESSNAAEFFFRVRVSVGGEKKRFSLKLIKNLSPLLRRGAQFQQKALK